MPGPSIISGPVSRLPFVLSEVGRRERIARHPTQSKSLPRTRSGGEPLASEATCSSERDKQDQQQSKARAH